MCCRLRGDAISSGPHRTSKHSVLFNRPLFLLLPGRYPLGSLDQLHEGEEALIVNLLVGRSVLTCSTKCRVSTDEELAIGNFLSRKEDQPCPPVAQRRTQVGLSRSSDDEVEVLPVARTDQVGVRELER